MIFFAAALLGGVAAIAQPVIPDTLTKAIGEEVSPANALKETAALTARVRYPNSEGFFEAAEYVAARAREYGLQNVRIERFPSSVPSWDPVEAEFDLVAPAARRFVSFADVPLLLAQHSKEGDVTADLVDTGRGAAASDYAGRNVKGNVALGTGSCMDMRRPALAAGAAAIVCASTGVFFGRRTPREGVSWNSVQDDILAMAISPAQADELRGMLRNGPVRVRLHARVKRTEPGAIGQVMGEIPGSAPDRDIVIAAHLDHQKPSANDNASGSGTLLEALRTYRQLLATGKVAKPRRTIRFWWSTEIRSEREYFRKHPEDAKKIMLAVVLDQAGGDRNAENNFIMILGPEWLPSYADDLIYSLAEHMREACAPAEHEPAPIFRAPEGTGQSMRTAYWEYAPLSDHISFEARDVGIPAISMAVPSLHVIHSSLDTMDRLDPTWMKRSAIMTLAPALFAASAEAEDARRMLDFTFRRAAARLAMAADPRAALGIEEKRLESVSALAGPLDTAHYRKRLGQVAAALEAAGK